jgi:hypothetical protein
MAIRQIGGAPVYVVEVNVPKVTDARGRSYGTLVSDLRWKLWEEVQNSQLQQMKYEQMSKQAQLDVLEQKQRDISRSIRDAREIQSKLKSGAISPGQAQRAAYQVAKAEQGKTVTRTEPARNPFTGEILEGQTVEIVTRTQPDFLMMEPPSAPTKEELGATSEFNEAEADVFNKKFGSLDEYIAGLESQQRETEAEFATAAGRMGIGDPLSRTRDAFQTQIGEGGFGISRRPLRQLPRFDERAAMGVIDEASKREESALIDEALRRKSQNAMNRITEIEAMGQEDEMTGALLADLNKQALNPQISLDEERKIRALARNRLAEGMTAAGAEPTSRGGFLMRDFPQGSALLPREETRFPTGRIRDDFGVESESDELDRETVVRGELERAVRLGSPEAEGLLMELEDIRRTKRAPVNASSSLPEAQRRAIEMDALGVTAEESQTRGATPSERGFTYPIERMNEGFGQTTTFGAPGGVLDRTNVATRRLPEALSPSQEREEMDSIQFGGGVIPGPPTLPGMEDAATDEVEEIEDTVTVPGRELPEGSALPQTKKTVPQRRELYSMKIVKEGAKLAEKPKQFARVSKSDNPASAPEYVRLVNQIYELNSNRPDRFKLTFDEIARVYRDDPKTREKAHAFLVAADMLNEGITRPQA